MSKNLVIVLSDNEYKEIHDMAQKRGISASKYARDLIFPYEDSFESKWKDLLDKIKVYPAMADFDISIIIGEEWAKFDRSTKLSLARTLSRSVSEGSIENVIAVGRSSSNVTIYRKL